LGVVAEPLLVSSVTTFLVFYVVVPESAPQFVTETDSSSAMQAGRQARLTYFQLISGTLGFVAALYLDELPFLQTLHPINTLIEYRIPTD